MPVGRIVLKIISESKKLSLLKTDGARLLYTWLIPHLNVNGCYSADPVVISGKVFTRLGKTIEEINQYLNNLEENNLIIRYSTDGDDFLIMPNFKEKQPSLNPSREGKINIPLPTPGQLQSRSRPTPTEYKDKLNISKVKSTADAPFILPTKEEIQESSEPKILEDIKNVCEALYKENIFPEVNSFKNKMLKKKKNERGILHVLTRCYLSKPEEPWGFCQKVLESEDMNYNASDYQKTAR